MGRGADTLLKINTSELAKIIGGMNCYEAWLPIKEDKGMALANDSKDMCGVQVCGSGMRIVYNSLSQTPW